MSNRVQKVFEKPSLTKQSFKAECDINLIMKRFKKTQGVDFMDSVKTAVSGQYGDFSNVPDYRAALDQVNNAKAMFGSLPSKVRARFSNDPAEFLDFMHDSRNVDEAIALGLVTKRAPKKDAPVEAEVPTK